MEDEQAKELPSNLLRDEGDEDHDPDWLPPGTSGQNDDSESEEGEDQTGGGGEVEEEESRIQREDGEE